MNHLDQLKAKLTVKPSIKKRELVAVAIKGDNKHAKSTSPIKKDNRKKTIGAELAEGIMDLLLI